MTTRLPAGACAEASVTIARPIQLLWEIATVTIANGRRERRLASSVSWLQSNGSDTPDKGR